MIRIVNKHWHKPTQDDVYCGRGSPVGNPYSHLPSSDESVIKVQTREEAINLFASNFLRRYTNDSLFRRGIDIIYERELDGKDTNLVCFCAPAKCHCEVIRDFVMNMVDNTPTV